MYKNNSEHAVPHDLLQKLAHLPKKIVALEGLEHTPSFVLHELCHERAFNLSKAAFFIDNPDFNHFKGVAGFDSSVAFGDAERMWQDPQSFISHLQGMSFNQLVRQSVQPSILKNGDFDPFKAQEIAQKLGIKVPAFRTWEMKHDNYGFLVYEYSGQKLDGVEEHLFNSLYLLNFCPLF